MKLEISGGQLRSFKKGKAFQLSKQQLHGVPKKGKMHEIEIDDGHYSKIVKAAKAGKGYRVQGQGVISSIGKKAGLAKSTKGKGILKSIKKTANKVSKGVSKVADTAVDYVKNDLVDDVKEVKTEIDDFGHKYDIGGKVEMAKKVVPKSVVQTAFSSALIATGMDPEAANIAAGSAVGAIYNVDFSKKLENQGDKAAIGAVQGGVSAGISNSKASKKETAAGSIKGRNHMAMDYSKGPALSRGGSVMKPSVMARPSKPLKLPPLSKEAKAKNSIMLQTNTSVGGSFLPLSTGGSFQPLGTTAAGSFRPLGTGNGLKGATPKKGSQEAKDKMSRLRAMRKKKN